MSHLKETLLIDGVRPLVLKDCVQLVDDEVRSKGGLSGIAVKGAYKIVTKIKPGIIDEAVDRLLDGFVGKLEPFYADCQAEGAQNFATFVSTRRPQIASALLGVTDDKIRGAKNRTIKKAYDKLRPTGQKHVEEAVPGVARVIDRHTA